MKIRTNCKFAFKRNIKNENTKPSNPQENRQLALGKAPGEPKWLRYSVVKHAKQLSTMYSLPRRFDASALTALLWSQQNKGAFVKKFIKNPRSHFY